MKTALVKNIQGDGVWDTPDGNRLYKFEIEFDNGDSGLFFSTKQEQTSFTIGQTGSYTIAQGKNGNKIKVARDWKPKNGATKSPFEKDTITWLACLKATAELHAGSGLTSEEIADTADYFFNRCKKAAVGNLDVHQPQQV